MNVRNLVVAVVTLTVALAGATEQQTAFRASQAEASLRGATNIVFRQILLGKEVKVQEFTVVEPGVLRTLTPSIRLSKETGNKCEFLLQADFRGPSGTILVQFNEGYFVVVESPGPKNYKDHTYTMPKEFYAQFLQLAKEHSWQVGKP